MATTPSNSGGDDEDDRESVCSGAEEAEEDVNDGEDEGEEEVEGDGEEEEEEEGEEEEDEEEQGGSEQGVCYEEAEDFGSQRPKVLRKTPLPDEGEEAEGGGEEASSEEDEAPPTHDSRKPAAAPATAPAKQAPPVAAAAPAAAPKKKGGSLSQATLVDKLKPAPKKPAGKSTEAPADASKGPLDASRPRGGKAATKAKPAPAASSGASTASTASAKPNGKQKAAAATDKAKVANAKAVVKEWVAAKRFEQSEDEEDGVSGEEAEAEACMNRPGEGHLAHQLPTLQDSHPDVHMEADAAREREAASGGGREAPPRQSGPPAKKVIARVDPAALQQTAVFKAVGLAHRWYKHDPKAIAHQITEGHEGDATPFEVPFFHYVEKGNNNRAAFQKQLLEAHPEKFVALMRIAKASATTGGYADNLYHASIPITVVDDDSSPDLIRKFKESKPPDSALGSNSRVHWPLEPKVVELAYAEPNCPLPSCCDPKNAPKGDPKNGPKFVLIPGQNQIPNMEEWTHVSATKPRAPKAKAQQQQQPCGVEGAKRQKTNQPTLSFSAAPAAEAGAPAADAGAPAADDAAGEAGPSSAGRALVVAPPDAPSEAVQRKATLFDQLIQKYHVIEVADKDKVTMSKIPGSNRVVVCEWK